MVWLLAEALRLTLSAAQAADVALARLRLHTVAEFATTVGGRAALLSLTAAAMVCLLALVPARTRARHPGPAGRQCRARSLRTRGHRPRR